MISIFFAACQGQANKDTMYETIKGYLSTISDTLMIEKYDCILYVSEHGCPTCTKSFDKIVKENALNKEHILIIVNAKGHIFDIMPYFDSTNSNVVKDFTSVFYKLKISPTSCIIILKDKQVEQIIEMKAETLGENLSILQKLLIEHQ
ncbi:MAG: hypothetical protein LBR36_07210 [Bacteroidales bacterium]|nr:hypothetical protein [Bacteroidales bacterium]